MRTSWKKLAVVSACLVLVPQLAIAADEVAEQLKAMQERMAQLEDRLQATNDQLKVAEEQVSQQQVVIEQAGLDEERGAQSALSSFLADTEFGGAVAASYFYNPESPPAGRGGNGPISNPFHSASNTFLFDEFSLSIGRSADEAHTAGFQFDMMYGETASILGTDGNLLFGAPGFSSNGGDSIWIQNAYIEYNTGIANTVVTAGKFATHIGYENPFAADNVNVTRGFVWTLLQPVAQTGVKLSGDIEGFNWMLGAANGVGTNQIDTDHGKDLLASFGYANDMLSTSVNIDFGTDAEWKANGATAGGPPSRNSKLLIVNYIFELTPSDNLVAWLDMTFTDVIRSSAADPYGVGVAVGSRYAFTDKWGLGGRFEYAHLDSRNTGLVWFAGQMSDQLDLYSFTLTSDYMLADGLVLKIEGKYEVAANAKGNLSTTGVSPENIFPGADSDQFLIGAQMVYSF